MCVCYTLALALVLCLTIPVVFRQSTETRRYLLFMHQVKKKVPSLVEVGLNECTKLHFVPSNPVDIRLGLWYIPPDEKDCTEAQLVLNNQSSEHWFASDHRLVVLFVHGIMGSRGTSLRVSRYKVYSNTLHFHVVAFDYRGFGDSSAARPTAAALVNDTIAVYRWLLSSGVAPKRILVWGHSLGTAVTVRLLSTLDELSSPLAAVLETSLPDLGQVITALVKRTPFHWILPPVLSNYFFVQPMVSNAEFAFNSTKLLPMVRCALLIMHSQDDRIIPFELGQQLYESALRMQPPVFARQTIFSPFAGHLHYGHNLLVNDPAVPQIVLQFLDTIQRRLQMPQTQ